jgi:hypothetical protein
MQVFNFLIKMLNSCWEHDQDKRITFDDIYKDLLENENNFNFEQNFDNKMNINIDVDDKSIKIEEIKN